VFSHGISLEYVNSPLRFLWGAMDLNTKLRKPWNAGNLTLELSIWYHWNWISNEKYIKLDFWKHTHTHIPPRNSHISKSKIVGLQNFNIRGFIVIFYVYIQKKKKNTSKFCGSEILLCVGSTKQCVFADKSWCLHQTVTV
jgi:hypothetical protein